MTKSAALMAAIDREIIDGYASLGSDATQALADVSGVILDENGNVTGHHGTTRDYLLHRLNERHQHHRDPGHADYLGVAKTGHWEAAK